MRVLLKLSGLFFLSFLLFAIVQCNKTSSKDEDISDEHRDQFISQVENQLRTQGARVSVYFEKGEVQTKAKVSVPSNDLRTNSFCVAEFTLDVSRYDYWFTGDCSGGWTSYKGKVYFTITNVGSYPPPTDASMIDCDWYFTVSGSSSGPHTIDFDYVGTPSPNVYEYVTEDIDFSALSIDYCNVTVIANDMLIPPTGCPGGSTPITQNDGILLTISTFSKCKTIYPVFVQPNFSGSGTFGFSGWVLICTPCNFYGPQEFELQYRLQGTGSWTTRTENYVLGPYSVSGLSPGTYEYRYRNKMNSPTSCYGPYSEIQTMNIN